MKRKILIKFFSAILTLGLIKSSIVFAKEEPKKLEQKISSEEEKKQEIKIIKEVLKKRQNLEKQLQQNLLNMFKNFKKEDFEEKNYNLEVFKKNNAPILVYTHKKTGAQVYFNLFLDKEKILKKNDQITFRAPSKDDKGLVHFSEHCLADPTLKKFIKILKSSDDLNANTTKESLNFVSNANLFGLDEKLEKDYVKRLTKELNNPIVFKKGDKTFEIEKKRIIHEMKDRMYGETNYFNIENYVLKKNIRDYDIGGKVSELEKVTLNDFKNFYEKFINPSNCLIIKNVLELNPKKIKKYLNMWHENYFKNHEKKEVKDAKYEPKNKDKYLFHFRPKDSKIFLAEDVKENINKNFKYKAKITFNLKDLEEKEKQVFNLNLKALKKELRKFAKNLGYDFISVTRFETVLFGDKKENFTKEVLEENSKKIMNFIANKIKNLSEEEFLYFKNYSLKNSNKFEINNLNLKNAELNSEPNNYNNQSTMQMCVNESFLETGKAISNKEFLINKNSEIENSYETTSKIIKENLNGNSNVFLKLAKKGPQYIDVFKQSDKTIKQTFKKKHEKYEVLNKILPFKLKEEKSKKFVKDFANNLLANCFTEILSTQQGLVYSPFSPYEKIENNFSILFTLNKNSVKPLEDYFSKNFNEIMKKVNVKESELIKLKKQYKENFNSFKKFYEAYFENENKMIKDLESYAKTGKMDENSFLLNRFLTIRDFFFYCFPIDLMDTAKINLLTLYKDFENYNAFFEKEMSFKEKYSKMLDKKVTPKFAKDFLENFLKPTLKQLKKAYKLAKEKLKALNSITIKDVKALIKTAYLIEDKNEIEKVNKNIRKRCVRETNFENLLF